jgi:hypothetical protein
VNDAAKPARIVVRIPLVDFLGDLQCVEEKLTAGGITPELRHNGTVRRSVDYAQDVAVFEYIPREDMVLG